MALDTRDEDHATPDTMPPVTLDFRAVYDAHARSVRRFLGDLLRDDAAAVEGEERDSSRTPDAARATVEVRGRSVMCPQQTIDELEALVAEELDEESAERVRAHVAGCASCQAELKWLAAEAELMARRRAKEPALSPAVWQN